ncbi:hypothetical protein [Arabidopsis thaliana]|uniref:Uncharacterized protein F1O3.5 n=1 Tax=Arabidopsis thaliana TaxID=3702 RepID=Q9C7M6_ARATH|nr:hypothetical protein [Arabidopsis thaliana]
MTKETDDDDNDIPIQEDDEEKNPDQDYQELLDGLLNLSGRQLLMFYWDHELTEAVREGFEVISQKWMKGIDQMWVHWNTSRATVRSESASQFRNSDRGGLGPHRNISSQKSFVQVHEELEELYGRHVSLGEVFMKTHTRADGSFVDAKAEKVAEVYKKACEEKLTEIDDDGPKTSMNSSELSTHRDLNIDDKNEIFLQSAS